jgi:hypothetical protein
MLTSKGRRAEGPARVSHLLVCRVCRDGWKGRAIVALGCKQGTPLSMHPLLCAVSRPVRHARLAAALLR